MYGEVESIVEDQEIEDFIKTVDDDVLENKYSSSFEGKDVEEEI